MKTLQTVLCSAALLFAGLSWGLDVQVGRAKLALNSDKWQVLSQSNKPAAYGGEVSGTYGAAQKTLVLSDETGKLLAMLKIESTDAGAGVRMNFTGGCKKFKDPNAYAYDATRGSFTEMDCLRLLNVAYPKVFLERNFKADLTVIQEKKLQLPQKASYVVQMVGIGSGTYLYIGILLDETWVGAETGQIADGLPSTIKPEAAAWGQLLAKSVRDSVHSMSGDTPMPTITFKP